jgi:hypothetical protein
MKHSSNPDEKLSHRGSQVPECATGRAWHDQRGDTEHTDTVMPLGRGGRLSAPEDLSCRSGRQRVDERRDVGRYAAGRRERWDLALALWTPAPSGRTRVNVGRATRSGRRW